MTRTSIVLPPPALEPFALLWAFALFYHQSAYGYLTVSWLDQLLGALCLVVLVWPKSLKAFGALCAVHVLVVLKQLPDASNHWFFAGLVSLGIAGGLFHGVLSARGSTRSTSTGGEERLGRIVTACQLSLGLLYAGSGLHKLNRDFFSVPISCASTLARELLFFVEPGKIPSWLDGTFIGLTLVTELGLPVLLLVPRWRYTGVLLALGFHTVMALAGYPRFSATCGALLTLFVPRTAWRRVSAAFDNGSAMYLRVVAALVLLTSVLLAPAGSSRSPLLLIQLAVTGGFAFVVSKHWKRSAFETRELVSVQASPIALLSPLLLIFIIAQPYFGLATHRTMSMYSNLRTEAPQSNHLLLGNVRQPFQYQRDLVLVDSTNSPSLQSVVRKDHLIPFVELRARISDGLSAADAAPTFVSFQRGGRAFYVSDVVADSSLHVPIPMWHRLLFRFRSVERSGPRACTI